MLTYEYVKMNGIVLHSNEMRDDCPLYHTFYGTVAQFLDNGFREGMLVTTNADGVAFIDYSSKN